MKVTNNTFKKLLTIDTVFVVLVTVFFLVMFIETFSIFEMGGTSSALLPRLLCITGFIIGIIILVVKVLSTTDRDQKETDAGCSVTGTQKGINLVYSALFTIGYFCLVPLLGFILTTIIATVTFSFLMGYRKKITTVVVAIVTTILLYVIFASLLEVSLPQGIIIKSLLPL